MLTLHLSLECQPISCLNQSHDLVVRTVVFTASGIAAHQSAQVALTYSENSLGAMPDEGSQISIYVLGCNGNNNQNIYYVDATNYTLLWTPSNEESMSAMTMLHPQPLDDSVLTNTFDFENPIKCFISQNPSNQTYQAHIWIANPFAIPLLATVTQPLPTNVTVSDATGLLNDSSIIWTNTIATNGLVDDSFTFTFPVSPGTQTNLPAPTLVFSDSTGTNSWTIQAAAPTFTGVLPMQVSASIPSGSFGLDAPMQVDITNLTATNESGNLVVSITDLNGNVITNLSTAISVSGAGGTNLDIILPGDIPLGQYFVTGALNTDGSSGQVFVGIYVIPSMPITLGINSSVLSSTNGFNMMLTGPVNSNYLIEASTDLVNWTPILYFLNTNSPFYFNDSDATNYPARFYRAVPWNASDNNSGSVTNIIFSDSFSGSTIDSSKWITAGNTVLQTNQTMEVLTTVTDAGGGLTSVPIPINSTGKITITRKVFVHYQGDYGSTNFEGQFGIQIGSLPWFAIWYANMNYSDGISYMPRYGFFQTRNNARPDVIADSADVAPAITPLWDSWFSEKVTYDPTSGTMEYFINDVSQGTYNVGALPQTNSATMTLTFTAWGWYTGHEQLMQNLNISQVQ